MSGEHLAIASVPIQKWGEIYDDKEALDIGTVFKELNKPFFAASVVSDKKEKASGKKEQNQSAEQKNREEMLTAIYRICFALDDLTLYLDTHDKDQEAKELYLKKLQESEDLHKKFAEKFYPLTRQCIPYCYEKVDGKFCWQEGPMPWEGACV